MANFNKIAGFKAKVVKLLLFMLSLNMS